jgi:hypothetical protein
VIKNTNKERENCRASKKPKSPQLYVVCPYKLEKKEKVNAKTAACLGRPHRDWTALIRRYSAKQFWKGKN